MKIQLVPAKPLHVVGSGEECTGVVDRLEFFVYSLALMAVLILTVLVIWRIDVYQQERQAAGKGLCECPKKPVESDEKLPVMAKLWMSVQEGLPKTGLLDVQEAEHVEKQPRIKRAALPWKMSKPKKDGQEKGGVRKTAGMGSGSMGDLHPAEDLGSVKIHIPEHPRAELSTQKPLTLGPPSKKEGEGSWWGLGLFGAGVLAMVFCCIFCCYCRSRSFYGG